MRLEKFKSFLLCFSLANLLSIPAWQKLFSPDYAYRLYMDLPSQDLGAFNYFITILMTMGAVFLLGFSFFIGFHWIDSRQSKISRCLKNLAIVSLSLWMLNIVRYQTVVSAQWMQEHYLMTSLLSIALILLLICIYRYQDRFFQIVKTALLITSPFVLVTYFMAFDRAQHVYHYHNVSYPVAGTLVDSPRTHSKIIWIIFDELDLRIAFENRDENLSLPELDKFKDQSVFASNAYGGGHWTMVSVPSMLYGQNFVTVKPLSDSTLQLQNKNEIIHCSNELKSIFQSMREKNCNSAIAGCFHPYLRLFGGYLASCNSNWNNQKNGAWPSFAQIWKNLWDSFPGFRQLYCSSSQEEAILSAEIYTQTHTEFLDALKNPHIHFAFAHYLLPHPPAFYHAREERFCSAAESDYSGNLVLLDKTLSQIRQTLENIDEWESSTIVIVSDHGLRPTSQHCLSERDLAIISGDFDERVPLMIKMPFQQQELMYDRPVNTTAICGLLLGVAENQLKTAEDVANWLDVYPVKVPFSHLAQHSGITEGVFTSKKL
jgi:hypothetical protein